MSAPKFDLRDPVTGKLNIDKCLAFARNCPTTNRENNTASDEVLEILEVVVPGLVAELKGIDQKAIDKEAELVFDRAKESHLSKILKALRSIDIDANLSTVKFTLYPIGQSKDDPIIIEAKVPMEQWQLVPELNSRIKRITDARENRSDV